MEAVLLAFADSCAKPVAGTGDREKAAATSEFAANGVDGTNSNAADANAADAGTKATAGR